MVVPLWAWALVFVAVLLAIGWVMDRRRRLTRDLEMPAVTGHMGGPTPREVRDTGGGTSGGGFNGGASPS